jgi:hypothetical protein
MKMSSDRNEKQPIDRAQCDESSHVSFNQKS